MPERELDLEQSERERKENTNLRMPNLKNEGKEAQSIQQVYVSAEQHVKTKNPLFGWKATDRPLDVPPDNLNATSSTGTSINIFVRGMGVGLTHTEKLMIKKLREVRVTNGLELDQEEAEPTIERNFKTKFEIPTEYSENILITDSDFIFSDRTSSQVPGKYLCFLVTRANERNTIDTEHVMLALLRLRVFVVERGIREVSMPVYDPNRGKLNPRELYGILHVVFAETEITLHLHKKYNLSIA